MNTSQPWQALSVQAFLAQVNWDGRKAQPAIANLKRSQASSPFNGSILSWGSLSVTEFFNAQNWVGQPLNNEQFIQADDCFVPAYTANVQDFFRYLPWEGKPAIARLPEVKPAASGLNRTIPDDDEFTLTDLSDLF